MLSTGERNWEITENYSAWILMILMMCKPESPGLWGFWSLHWSPLSWHGRQKLHCSFAVSSANTSKRLSWVLLFPLNMASSQRQNPYSALAAELWAVQPQVRLKMGVYWECDVKPKYPGLLLSPDLLKGQLLLCPTPMNFTGANEIRSLVLLF